MHPAREKYELLLIELHREMKAGRGNETRAQELREEMASLWHDLVEGDRALFDELSEDLYLIEGKRRILPLRESETADNVRRDMGIAFNSRRYREALAIARKLADTSAPISYALGRCWDELHFRLGAVCFFDHAYALQPKAVYAVSSLESLSRASMKQAVGRAEEIASRSVVEGTLLLQAASVLYRGVMTVSPDERSAIYEKVIHIVDAAWTDTTALPSIRANGLVAAGYSHEHLDQDHEARQQFERASIIYPSEPALLAYGISLLKVDRAKAIEQITLAARQGTRFDWPYLYATEHALTAGRFAEAERFAEAGIERADRHELRGRLYEWSAIAGARLGRPTPIVIERFDRAMAELPFDATIQKNAAAFVEFAANVAWDVAPPPAPPTWQELELAA